LGIQPNLLALSSIFNLQKSVILKITKRRKRPSALQAAKLATKSHPHYHFPAGPLPITARS
jgi:hypothetical protein